MARRTRWIGGVDDTRSVSHPRFDAEENSHICLAE
jgi:hypothetical protein